MLELKTIEELKQYFQSKEEIVTKLPDKKNIEEGKLFLLKKDNTFTEYKLIEGEWSSGQTFTKGS